MIAPDTVTPAPVNVTVPPLRPGLPEATVPPLAVMVPARLMAPEVALMVTLPPFALVFGAPVVVMFPAAVPVTEPPVRLRLPPAAMSAALTASTLLAVAVRLTPFWSVVAKPNVMLFDACSRIVLPAANPAVSSATPSPHPRKRRS